MEIGHDTIIRGFRVKSVEIFINIAFDFQLTEVLFRYGTVWTAWFGGSGTNTDSFTIGNGHNVDQIKGQLKKLDKLLVTKNM